MSSPTSIFDVDKKAFRLKSLKALCETKLNSNFVIKAHESTDNLMVTYMVVHNDHAVFIADNFTIADDEIENRLFIPEIERLSLRNRKIIDENKTIG